MTLSDLERRDASGPIFLAEHGVGYVSMDLPRPHPRDGPQWTNVTKLRLLILFDLDEC